MKKKVLLIIFAFCLAFIFSGCPRDVSITYRTIKSVRVMLLSFDENGVFAYTDHFDRNELGIGIYPDSISESYELARSFSVINKAYAMEDPTQIIYTNIIESVNVTSVYDFDAEHPAGSNINDILLLLDDRGNTEETDINALSMEWYNLKFSVPPQNDSLQFKITGKITGEKEFDLKTELVILD
jgi:hypothetical protein